LTEEEAKAHGFNSLEEFCKEWRKITNHPPELKETGTAYDFHNKEKQQDRVQNHEKQKHS
jgi:hypothetical protein